MPDRILRYAAIFFAVGVAIHNGDHIARGATSVTTQLFWAGNVALVISVLAIVLVLVGHRSAPVAALVGFPLALAFAASHMTPEWSVLSDSFIDQDVSAFSVFASLLEIVAGLAFGAAGVYALRHQDIQRVPRAGVPRLSTR